MTSLANTKITYDDKVSMRKSFGRYVSQNIFAMVGLSCYVLVDTFFIANGIGNEGITILNLCLPIFNFIAAIGSMIAVGSAIEFAVAKAEGDKRKDNYFYNAVFFATVFGIIVMLLGLFAPAEILRLMGGRGEMVTKGIPYIRTFMFFGPTLVVNYTVNAFVRNDGEPTLAMISTIAGSLFNIVFDYIFVFPLHMGMFGAALATAFSPFVEMGICMIHFKSEKNSIRFLWKKPSILRAFNSCRIGVASFIGEFASGITITIFNYMILSISGNIGVAAYGIIANLSLVGVAICNGVSSGNQPLISHKYGERKMQDCKYLLKLGIVCVLILALIMYAIVVIWVDGIVALFNKENSRVLYGYARDGLIIYFVGFFFAGLNAIFSGYFSAMVKPKQAFVISMLRGIILIGLFAVLLGTLFGMNGVWLSFPAAEFVTFVVSIILYIYTSQERNDSFAVEESN